jgi:hypothetical protein
MCSFGASFSSSSRHEPAARWTPADKGPADFRARALVIDKSTRNDGTFARSDFIYDAAEAAKASVSTLTDPLDRNRTSKSRDVRASHQTKRAGACACCSD